MKMIDVLNMMAKGEIKEGTVVKIFNNINDKVDYEYDGNLNAFYDYDGHSLGDEFDINLDFFNKEVELIPPKEKKYLVKFNMRGLKEPFRYLNYIENDEFVHINDKRGIIFAKNRFTKDELQSIQPVREFLEDMEGKYKLIGVDDNETD